MLIIQKREHLEKNITGKTMRQKDIIEKTFEERERFINSLSDKNIYGWLCPVHKIIIGNGNKCPLCEHKIKDVEVDEVKREKDREYMRRKLKDPDQRRKHNERVANYYKKERARKKEHSFET